MSDKARIVIADDDKENAKLVEQSIQMDGHQTRVCSDGEAALHLVKSWTPHLVLLDVNMPKMDGLECLRKVRALPSSEYVASMMITSNGELDQIVKGLDLGADDYLVKPFRVDELRARVRAILRVKLLHDALRRANKRLEELTAKDDLTGLFNMRYMTKRIADEIELHKRKAANIACIMFDMDHFKLVNDNNDHLFGSHVLREVGQVALGAVRTCDILARYGGDEFLVLLPSTTVKDAMDVAERLRKAFENHAFKSGAHTAKVTASFGVSGTMNPSELDRIDSKELMRSADAAMYSAKTAGRNRVETLNFIK